MNTTCSSYCINTNEIPLKYKCKRKFEHTLKLPVGDVILCEVYRTALGFVLTYWKSIFHTSFWKNPIKIFEEALCYKNVGNN